MNIDNDIMDNKVECGGSVFFDWSCVDNGGGVDVYYTFRGSICSKLKGGVNNVLYGKRVNLSKLYGEMMDDVSEYIIGGRLFLEGVADKHGHVHMLTSVNRYTTDKYGISMGWVIGVIKNDMSGYTIDGIYGCMIERAGGVDKIDWMRLYEKNRGFNTNRSDILLYIANRIISDGSIYKYFVNRYKLKAVGVEVNDNDRRVIVLEWDGGRRLIPLSKFVWNKRDWWRLMTYNDNSDIKERTKIRDYDVLLNGRREDEVLPDVCPIDNNIVLNYTRIDFSTNNDNNLDECRRHNDIGGDGDKIWSY